jgi:hypothetical protein
MDTSHRLVRSRSLSRWDVVNTRNVKSTEVRIVRTLTEIHGIKTLIPRNEA